jgi:hypothetical protein
VFLRWRWLLNLYSAPKQFLSTAEQIVLCHRGFEASIPHVAPVKLQ